MSRLEARVKLSREDLQLDAELHVDEGITALFGPSGAGKTTLLHCVAGLLRPEEGRVRLGDRVLFDASSGRDVPVEQRRIGYVFQDGRLFPHLTVRQNLRYGYRLVPPARRRTRPEEIHELLELAPLLERSARSLSGGEARRVAIGRALLAAPELLLLDEPLAGLDEARKGAVLGLLARIRADLGVPMLLVSHSLSEILELTTTVAVIGAGKTLGQGELHEVLGHDEVFRLADSLGLESLLVVEIVGTDVEGGLTRARLGSQEFSLPLVDRAPGTRGIVAVRPEDVILSRGPVEGISAQNALAGRVSRVNQLADRLLVTVDVGAPLRVEISARAAARLEIAPGAAVHCLIKAFSFRWRRFDGPNTSLDALPARTDGP